MILLLVVKVLNTIKGKVKLNDCINNKMAKKIKNIITYAPMEQINDVIFNLNLRYFNNLFTLVFVDI